VKLHSRASYSARTTCLFLLAIWDVASVQFPIIHRHSVNLNPPKTTNYYPKLSKPKEPSWNIRSMSNKTATRPTGNANTVWKLSYL